MMVMSNHASFLFFSSGFFLRLALSSFDFPIGSQVTVQTPPVYQPGFTGSAMVVSANGRHPPAFSAAVNVEASDGRYLCSLVLFLGDVKVWASDHLSKFASARRCTLELTDDGELRLTDGAGFVGWQAATAMRGAKRLHLESSTGNLVLLGKNNRTLWQSFDHPTDTLLWSERLDTPLYLTAFPANSSPFYSFELHPNRIVTHLNVRGSKYSYWELAPSGNRTIAFARLSSRGLKAFDGQSKKILQISPVKEKPVRFLALANDGNFAMYYYSPSHENFTTPYRALEFCDLPLSCGVYGICSSTGDCKHLDGELFRPVHHGNFCDASGIEVDMVQLSGVVTVLRSASPLVNVTLEQCVGLCLRSCSCAAALYLDGSDSTGGGVCSHYGLMAGAREVSTSQFSYWVKVPKATGSGDGGGGDDISAGLVAKILIIGGVIDVLALCLIVGALVYYFLHDCKSDGMGDADER